MLKLNILNNKVIMFTIWFRGNSYQICHDIPSIVKLQITKAILGESFCDSNSIICYYMNKYNLITKKSYYIYLIYIVYNSHVDDILLCDLNTYNIYSKHRAISLYEQHKIISILTTCNTNLHMNGFYYIDIIQMICICIHQAKQNPENYIDEVWLQILLNVPNDIKKEILSWLPIYAIYEYQFKNVVDLVPIYNARLIYVIPNDTYDLYIV